MLLDRYERENLFFNMNFKEAAGEGQAAYRGDLVLVEGEVADASGRRKPPTATVRQAVLFTSGDKLVMAAGSLDELSKLEAFTARYAVDFAPGIKLLFFVTNIGAPMQIDLGTATACVLPIEDGMVWTELLEELRLDKDDLKGQSTGGKVGVAYKAFADYKPRGEVLPLATALTKTIEVKRSGRGPV